MRNVVISIILLMALSACSYGPKKLYKGPELQEKQVARLTGTYKISYGNQKRDDYYPTEIALIKLDAESVSNPTSLRGYHILPGKHSIELKYTWDAPEASEGELSKEVATNIALLPVMLLALAGEGATSCYGRTRGWWW